MRARAALLSIAALVCGCGTFGSDDCSGIFGDDDPNVFLPKFDAATAAADVAAVARPAPTALRVAVKPVRPPAAAKDGPADATILPLLTQQLAAALTALGCFEKVEVVTGDAAAASFDVIVDPQIVIARSWRKSGLGRTQYLCTTFQIGAALYQPDRQPLATVEGERVSRDQTSKQKSGAYNQVIYFELGRSVYAKLLQLGVQVAGAPQVQSYAAAVKAKRDAVARTDPVVKPNPVKPDPVKPEPVKPVPAGSPAELAEAAKIARIRTVTRK